MIQADYYNGRTAKRHAVSLWISGSALHLSGAGLERHVPLGELDISESLGATPRLLRFADGAYCEVHDHAALEAALAHIGYRDGRVDRWQRTWRAAAAALALTVAAVFTGYRWGLPWFAEIVAEHLPPAVVDSLGAHTLQILDDGLFRPSRRSDNRRDEIFSRFEALRWPEDAQPPRRVLFRTSSEMGPNAVTLPDGTIILLDELVKLADNDEQILAVLGHESGHVHYRHGLRMLVQGSIVGAVSTWYFGDVSSFLAAAQTALVNARYSQAFEREADAYAAQLLRANGIAPARLAEMLEKLEAARGAGTTPEDGRWRDYLSSHPASAERIKTLRAL